MSRSHLVICDTHAHPDYSNKRADYLAWLIIDLKPDVVIHIGDGPDMHSLASYDKGKKCFQGRSYRKDVDSWLDFQDRMWFPVKRRKKKLPETHYIWGNHDQRIQRAVEFQPELEGAIGMDDLMLERYWDNVVPYNGGTPGIVLVDGVAYSHFFVSGVMGRGISGERPAFSLINKKLQSCTQGHVHILDICVRTSAEGKKIQGLVGGCYVDYNQSWAGHAQDLWWSGVIYKKNVDQGQYDFSTIGLPTLAKEYG